MIVQIERARPEDVPKLIEVQDLAFHEEFERYEVCPSYRESPAAMLDMVQNAFVYTIRIDAQVVGDLIVRDRGEGCYYLRTIAVVPAFQRRGIGGEAIRLLELEFPHAVRWTLETPEGTPKNHAFYDALGYHKIGETRISERLTLRHYEKLLAV